MSSASGADLLKGTNRSESEMTTSTECSAPYICLHCGPSIRGSIQFDISSIVKEKAANCTVYIHTDTRERDQCKSGVSAWSVTCVAGCHLNGLEWQRHIHRLIGSGIDKEKFIFMLNV